MKKKISSFIEWFEEKFSFIIDLIALLGATFVILLGVFLFILSLFGNAEFINVFEIIILPGVLGFFGIIMLFALRITRSLSK